MSVPSVFQSTLSSRRATGDQKQSCCGEEISIHALLTESDCIAHKLHPSAPISIHALLTESDRLNTSPPSPYLGFQSTLSSRRATTSPSASVPIAGFQSTLSSRRATFDFLAYSRFDNHFNPRSPHGERPPASTACRFAGQFQSTLSSRRATRDAGIGELDLIISIHALLTESDWPNMGIILHLCPFQSTLSSRRATGPQGVSVTNATVISIHALLTESDPPYPTTCR